MDDALPPLDPAEVRVLGALIEKQITTPDYYPLSLHALTTACNQLTNREPVVSFDENTVIRAIDRLREKRLATHYAGAESRVAKYKHTLTDAILLTPAEVALLCVLMLRGPQTIGELRTRSERLFRFDSLAEVEETLQALASRQPTPLVSRLPRAPGTKEARFAHHFSGPPEAAAVSPVSPPLPETPLPPEAPDRVVRLESEVAALREELARLRHEFAEFRRQFE
ncbi:MAG: YceH family protein [Verrucomicrobia bacterium]|nr:YceH family protein [Verrucomicrobiota bacterium]